MAPVSNAEKQRVYRQRRNADPARRIQYLAKKIEKYQADKRNGKRQLIASKTTREQRIQRKYWREHQRNCRNREKISLDTPPPTPEGGNGHANANRQRRQGRKMIARDRSKVVRDNISLRKQLESKTRTINRYKMRLVRLKKATTAGEESPRTKTQKLLRHVLSPTHTVRKTLTFHHVLIHGLRNRYKATKNQREKQNIKRILTGKIIKKYKCLTLARKEIGFLGTRNIANKHERISRVATDLRKQLYDFFERDDVSRVAAGKKNTITRNKQKKQRRLLLDSLENLHLKFMSESPLSASYSFFCRMRPFWVVAPTERDRDTCLCMTHDNMQFITDKLFKLNIIGTKDISSIVKAVVCDTESKDCAYSTCATCKLTAYPLQQQPEHVTISVQQWQRQKKERKLKNSEDIVESVITAKTEIEIQDDELVEKFQSELDRLKKHIFNIRRQFNIYQNLRQKLQPNECLIHVDFSEDYVCRYSTEIQSVHFGGSHKHACLHTGVLYLSSSTDAISFCTISDSTRHDPAAIWAHLDPVLTWIKTKHPQFDTLHVFSDSPSTQYRQKANFYLLSKQPFELGFAKISWNFFEASHGKGAPDGVGGSLKRTADRLTRQGRDIPNASSLFRELQRTETAVQLFYVDEKNIEAMSDILTSAGPLTPVKGTMQIHQVISLSPYSLRVRVISCLCGKETGVLDCLCFGLRAARVTKRNEENDQLQNFPGTQQATESTRDLSMEQVDGIELTEPTNTSTGDATNLEISPDVPTTQGLLTRRPEVISPEHVEEWCVVEYDGVTYPGIITAVENDDIQINCMHKVGNNRFFWPLHPDRNWYTDEQIICFIPEPTYANRRHVIIDNAIWKEIEKVLQDI